MKQERIIAYGDKSRFPPKQITKEVYRILVQAVRDVEKNEAKAKQSAK